MQNHMVRRTRLEIDPSSIIIIINNILYSILLIWIFLNQRCIFFLTPPPKKNKKQILSRVLFSELWEINKILVKSIPLSPRE